MTASKPALTNDQKAAFNQALDMAVERKDIDMMRLALKNGAEANRLLFQAIAFKPRWRDYFNDEHADEIGLNWAKIAVEFGADVKATKNDGQKNPWAALHWLYDNFNPKFMDYLIAQGADVDVKGANGKSMLLMAVQEGKAEIAEYLITKGADPMLVCGDKGNFALRELENSDNFKRAKKAELLMKMMAAVEAKTNPLPAPVPAPAEATAVTHEVEALKPVTFHKQQHDTPPPPTSAPAAPAPEKRGFSL